VVNMSYFIDPWLFNCTANPADSPEEQQEQRTIIRATQQALNFARSRGVTLIAAEGNEFTDLGHPSIDDTSPDFPPDAAKERTIDNATCFTEPTEAEGVIAVSAVGPPNGGVARKSYYSNYGVEQTDVAAPGGDSREFFGTPQYLAPQNRILAPYPLNVAQACGEVDANGAPRTDGTSLCVVGHEGTPWPRTTPVVRDCSQGTCGLYQWLQGTSMAAPHAVGVAALIVAEFGKKDRKSGGVTLDPRTTERILKRTATDTPCPPGSPAPFHYPGQPADFDAVCEGDAAFNGFYGEGIVNADRAVR
jgi:subtilisin family serine protease